MSKKRCIYISFKYKGRVVYIHRLKHMAKGMNTYIVIKDYLGNVITSQNIYKNSLISIDLMELGSYKIVYCSEKESFDYEDIKIDVEDTLFADIKRLLYQQVDVFTDLSEQQYHLKMIRSCNYDLKAREYVENIIRRLIRNNFNISKELTELYTYKVFSDVYGLGIIQELDDDEEISEIMVNVLPGEEISTKIYYIKDGIKYRYDKYFKTIDEVKTVFNRVLSGTGKELNSKGNSSIEVSRPNKDRVSMTVPNFSKNYSLNIRRFNGFSPSDKNMKERGTINDDLKELLGIIVNSEFNIGIGGKMNVGKSTLINYLLTLVDDPDERSCIISGVDETDSNRTLKDKDILIYNVDESQGFTFDEAFIKSLRSTSNRVIVPESRDKEFKQIYKSCVQTSGNIFTAHAFSDETFLNACVDMYNYNNDFGNIEELKLMIAKALDIIIIMTKKGRDFRLKSVSEVCVEGEEIIFNELYKWEFDVNNPTKCYYKKTGNSFSPQRKARMNEKGISLELINKW